MNLEMSETTRRILNRERMVIANLNALLSRLDASEDDFEELRSALRDLEGLFMLVVCGEFNAGKSTFLNALLGQKVMLEGVTPTTDRITIVSYGSSERDLEESDLILKRQYPADMLRDLALVDTPGTNAIIKKHQELTERFIPRADIVLFVTSADRAFTESERSFLKLISSWGKKIVVVINKLDILEEDDERDKVIQFVADHAKETLGISPQIFGVAARKALRAKQNNDPEALKASGLPPLERFIEATLAGSERVHLKMNNPLGVAQRIATSYNDVIHNRLQLLDDDRRTLSEIDRQLKQFKIDMEREVENYLARVKTVLLEVERRGDVFFDDMVRIERFFSLVNSDKVSRLFQEKVIRGADQEIDRALAEMADWFIQRNLQVWEDVMRFVNTRRKAGEDKVIGEVGGRFQYDRDSLIRTINQSAQNVLENYDENAEARRFANSLQGAVWRSGLLQVSGLGLGAALITALSGAMYDITGVLAGLTIASVGLFVLPMRRRSAKRELHQQMQTLRDQLGDSLQQQFDTELNHASEKLVGAISSYTRFVRSELSRLQDLQQELDTTRTSLSELRSDIKALP